MEDRYTTTEADAARFEQIRAADCPMNSHDVDDHPTIAAFEVIAADAAAAVASEVLYAADHPRTPTLIGGASYVSADQIREAVRHGMRAARSDA